jgi:hypothetical protein
MKLALVMIALLLGAGLAVTTGDPEAQTPNLHETLAQHMSDQTCTAPRFSSRG